MLAANRANARQSAARRREPANRRPAEGTGRHLILAKVTLSNMKELGEDPAQFAKLRYALFRAVKPRDGFEIALVEDMVRLRWRLLRLYRAEAGILTAQRRKFEIEHESEVTGYGKGKEGHADQLLLKILGLSGLQDSAFKFSQVLEQLKALRWGVLDYGFEERGMEVLGVVYGPTPGLAGALLMKSYEQCRKAQETEDAARQASARESFLKDLDAEIACFERLAELKQALDVDLAGPMADAQLLLSEEDLDKILRYEAALEGRFERKLELLMGWRKTRPRALPAKTLGPKQEDEKSLE